MRTKGLVDEFKLIFSVREELPLHTLLFKQVSSHLAHEGNAEETFSLSGKLSNDNTHTQPGFLATLVRINKNRSRCDPSASDILKGYKKKYGKLPELGEDVVPDAEAEPEAEDAADADSESSDADSAD